MELKGSHYAVHRHWSLGPLLNHMNPFHPITIRPLLKLSLHLCLQIPSVFFPSGFSDWIFVCLQSYTLWFDYVNNIWWKNTSFEALHYLFLSGFSDSIFVCLQSYILWFDYVNNTWWKNTSFEALHYSFLSSSLVISSIFAVTFLTASFVHTAFFFLLQNRHTWPLCGTGTFGKVWSAFGQHEIQCKMKSE